MSRNSTLMFSLHLLTFLINLKSTAFRFRVNRRHGTDRRTDGRGATLSPDTSVLWPLCSAARMRVRCWCFTLCEDSGM